MKKSLIKKLNNELDAIIPVLDKTVIDAPITVLERSEEVNSVKNKKRGGVKDFFARVFSTKRAIAAFSTGLACLMAVFVAVPFMTRGGSSDGSVIVLEINPSVRILSMDGDEVTGVVSNNSDGDVLLSDDTFLNSLKGKSIQNAVNLISYKAVEYGYINGSDTPNRIQLSVLKEDDKKAVDSALSLENGLIDFLCDEGIFAIVEGDSINKIEYSQKFDTVVESVKDDVKELEQRSVLTLDTIVPSIVEIESKYKEVVESFIEDIRNRCDEIKAKYLAIAEIAAEYFALQVKGIEDPFGNDIEDNDFLRKVEDFNAKYGETLTQKRFNELLDFSSKFVERFNEMLNELYNPLPKTPEEFSERVNVMLLNRAELLKNGASDFYKKERPKITKAEYSQYLQTCGIK